MYCNFSFAFRPFHIFLFCRFLVLSLLLSPEPESEAQPAQCLSLQLAVDANCWKKNVAVDALLVLSLAVSMLLSTSAIQTKTTMNQFNAFVFILKKAHVKRMSDCTSD